MGVAKELKVLTEACRLPPRDGEVMLVLLQRVQELQGVARGYHYYSDSYALERDSAEACLLCERFEEAVAHARRAQRSDLEGIALANMGDVRGALDVWEIGRINQNQMSSMSKVHGVQVLRWMRAELKQAFSRERARNEWPRLTQMLLARFGSWESALFAEQRVVEDSKEVAKREGLTSIPLQERTAGRLEMARSIVEAESRETAYRQRVRDALRRGSASDRLGMIESELKTRGDIDFSQAELVPEIRQRFLDPLHETRMQLEEWRRDLLIELGRFDEVLELLSGRYLGRDLELLLNLKLSLGRELNGRDLMYNFYWLLEKPSAYIERVFSWYVDAANEQLAGFGERYGRGPLEYVATLPETKPRIPDYRFGRKRACWIDWYATPLAPVLKPHMLEVDVKVRERLGVLSNDVRWKSERAMYSVVKRQLAPLEVVRGARPRWLGPQHLDIFVPTLKLAVEYMGRQHYEAVDFFGGVDALVETQKRDRRKQELCQLNGVELVLVRYDECWEAVGAKISAIADGLAVHRN